MRRVEPLDEELLAFGVEVEELAERKVVDGERPGIHQALGVGEAVPLLDEEVKHVRGDGLRGNGQRVYPVDFLDQRAPDYYRVAI